MLQDLIVDVNTVHMDVAQMVLLLDKILLEPIAIVHILHMDVVMNQMI